LISIFSNLVIAGSGGVAVPVKDIGITDNAISHNSKASRLKFEFSGEQYAIQLRRVEQDYTHFLVIKLNENKLSDVNAFTIRESFNLTPSQDTEIDLNKDNIEDIYLKLNDITGTGRFNNVMHAEFFIKKISGVTTENKRTVKPIIEDLNKTLPVVLPEEQEEVNDVSIGLPDLVNETDSVVGNKTDQDSNPSIILPINQTESKSEENNTLSIINPVNETKVNMKITDGNSIEEGITISVTNSLTGAVVSNYPGELNYSGLLGRLLVFLRGLV